MSYSRFVFDRFKLRARRRVWVAAIYIAAMLGYLGWRVTIINAAALPLSLTYYIAEVIGFVLGLTMIFCSLTYRHRTTKPAPRGRSVDVFVPTYREPIEMVRWTAMAAAEIAYPHETYILDDGNRADIRELARELGVHYLPRAKNVGAKAGNLNNGLAHSSGEFVMVFDADHMAMPHALDVTLGYFADERVGLVQTPQDFYNVNSFQYYNAPGSGALWHDQSFYYSLAQPCRDAFNAASCIGTGVVYRRSALADIGGVPMDTVTEDMHTSLLMHKAGWECVYLTEPVAYGVAASDLREYYRTRHRWAHGNLHVLRIENVLGRNKLSFVQRLSYLTLGLIYLEGWQQLLLFLVPVASLLFGWAPFQITVLNVLVVLLFPILTILLLQESGGGLARPWVNELYSMARFPLHLAAWAALFVGKMPFRTSSKRMRGAVEWRLMLPQLSVMALSLAALTVGSVNLALNFKIGPLGDAARSMFRGDFSDIAWSARLDQGYTLELVVVAGFWTLFNAARALVLLRKAVVDARRSEDDYLFDVDLVAEFDLPDGPAMARVTQVSRSRIVGQFGDARSAASATGASVAGRLFLPAGAVPIGVAMAGGQGRRQMLPRRLGRLFGSRRGADTRFAGALQWERPRDSDRLMRALYSVDWQREYRHTTALFSTPLDVLERLIRLRAPFPPRGAAWSPAVYRMTAIEEPSCAVVTIGGTEAKVIAFRAIYPGTLLEFEVFGEEGPETRFIRILGPEPRHSLGSRGLDGAEVRKFRGQIETGAAVLEPQAAVTAAE